MIAFEMRDHITNNAVRCKNHDCQITHLFGLPRCDLVCSIRLVVHRLPCELTGKGISMARGPHNPPVLLAAFVDVMLMSSPFS